MQQPMDSSDGGTIDVLHVPSDTVGLIIGRSGEQVRAIEAQCSCRVQMAQDADANRGGTRQCTISGGSASAVARAKNMIMDIVTRAGHRQQQTTGFAGGNAVDPTLHSAEVIVPRAAVGSIIGRGGENVKNMSATTGAWIQFKTDGGQWDPCTSPLSSPQIRC